MRQWSEDFQPSWSRMAEIKRGHYKNLAHQMQRAESKIIFGACRDLMNRHPDVPLWTIHDCLLTVPGLGYEEIVEDALLMNFAKHGVKTKHQEGAIWNVMNVTNAI